MLRLTNAVLYRDGFPSASLTMEGNKLNPSHFFITLGHKQ